MPLRRARYVAFKADRGLVAQLVNSRIWEDFP